MARSRSFSPALIPLALAALTLSGVSVAVFFAMSAKMNQAQQVTERLRGSYEVSQRLIQARAILTLGGQGDWLKASARLASADDMLAGVLPQAQVQPVRADIQAARSQLGRGAVPINHALSRLASVSVQLRQEAVDLDRAAAGLSLWGAVGVVAAVLATAGAMFIALRALQKNLEEKVRTQAAELARAERLASVGFLAAGVAHEINNPLAIIVAEAELASRAAAKGQATPEALAVVVGEAQRCKTITEKLLASARGERQGQRCDMVAQAQSALELARRLDQAKTVDLRLGATPPSAMVWADPAQVRQVLLTLLVNAMEAAPGGEVRVTIQVADGLAQVRVRDNGAGIAPANLPAVFEPFFTTKKHPEQPGLGLGLSIAHAIVRAQGGSLRAASAGVGQGSAFTLEWPLFKKDAA